MFYNFLRNYEYQDYEVIFYNLKLLNLSSLVNFSSQEDYVIFSQSEYKSATISARLFNDIEQYVSPIPPLLLNFKQFCNLIIQLFLFNQKIANLEMLNNLNLQKKLQE